MSKSTGSKGSDNNSKGSNTSDSDSEGSKGTSSSNKGGGNSGASQAASKAAADAKAAADKAAADTKAAADSASKAQADADKASADKAASQHQQTLDASQAEQTKSTETYKGFMDAVMDAAPVGYDNINKGRFGTELSDAEVMNAVSEVEHGFKANEAWNEGRYGDWASEKIGGLVDSVQGWGYQQARELTQAPLDKAASMARDPTVQGAALMLGGPIGALVTTGIAAVDSVADYAQGEKTAKQAAFQGIGDLVTGFGPPQAKFAYAAVTNPKQAAKTALGTMTGGITDPIGSVVMNRAINFGVNQMAEGITSPNLSTDAMGPSLLASRQKADQSYQSRVERTTGSYTKPQVMSDDALLLPYERWQLQEKNKPRYSSSMLFGIS